MIIFYCVYIDVIKLSICFKVLFVSSNDEMQLNRHPYVETIRDKRERYTPSYLNDFEDKCILNIIKYKYFSVKFVLKKM